MNPQNTRYLFLGLIVVAVAAVCIFSPRLAQTILDNVTAAVPFVALLIFLAFLWLR